MFGAAHRGTKPLRGEIERWGVRWCILAADEKTSDPHDPSVERFRQFVELRDLRPRTRESYSSYVVAIAQQRRDPATLSEDAVQAFFAFLRKEQRYAPSSMRLAIAALRCFYKDHLQIGRDWSLWRTWRAREPQSLPTVPSREEVALLLTSVRCGRFCTIRRLLCASATRARIVSRELS